MAGFSAGLRGLRQVTLAWNAQEDWILSFSLGLYLWLSVRLREDSSPKEGRFLTKGSTVFLTYTGDILVQKRYLSSWQKIPH